MFTAPNNRMIGSAPRMRATTLEHAGTTWQVYEPDRLPERRFGCWFIVATYDDGQQPVLLEALGTGVGASVNHRARVRAARWHELTTGRVRIAVTDARNLKPGDLGR